MNYYQDGPDYVKGYNPVISDTRILVEYQDDTKQDDNEYHHINWIIDELFNTPLIENQS